MQRKLWSRLYSLLSLFRYPKPPAGVGEENVESGKMGESEIDSAGACRPTPLSSPCIILERRGLFTFSRIEPSSPSTFGEGLLIVLSVVGRG